MTKGTDIAPEPLRWVCAVCGKTSRSRYGFNWAEKSVADPGWDESCMLHAVLCRPADSEGYGLCGDWVAVTDDLTPAEAGAIKAAQDAAKKDPP